MHTCARQLDYLLIFCASTFLSLPLWGQFTDPVILDKSDVFGGDGYYPGERMMDIADFDQDGLDDILLLGFQGPIWYKGTPTGFEAARQIGAREEACVRDVRAGDLNGDGLPDIFTVDAQGAAMIWYQNLGAGEFSSTTMPVTTYIVDQCQHFSELADIDGDGDLDVVIAWNFGVGIRWFSNNGAGSFSSEQSVITDGNGKNGITDFVVDDIDGDGDQDVISANTNVVYDGLFLTRRGTSSFFPAVDILPEGISVSAIAVGDLDGDGQKDIAFSSNAPESIRILRNNGAGGFDLSPLVLPGHFLGDLEMADVDGDGRLDLLSAPPLNSPAGTLVVRNTSVSELSFEQLAEIDHEERPHLLVWPDPTGARIISREAAPEAGAYIKVHQYNTGTSAWSSETISAKIPRDALVVADMNNDGALDMLGCDDIGSAVTLYSQGPDDLEFSAEVLFTGPGKPVDLWTGDFDGDADQDMLVWSSLPGSNPGTGLFFVRNNGANGFAHDTLLAFTPPGPSRTLKIVDLDADGDLDIFLGFYEYDLVRFFENNGNGSFTYTSTDLSVTPRAFNVIDFDQDGLVDILITTATQAFRWMRNNGELSFTLMPYSASGPGGIQNADIDNDGDEDLYIIANNALTWWPRTGPVTFDPSVVNPVPATTGAITLTDLDSDGLLDYVRELTTTSVWYPGLGNGAFGSPPQTIYEGHIATASQSKPSLYVDLDQDGDKEIVLRALIAARQQPHLLLMENLSVIGTQVQEAHLSSLSVFPNPFTTHTVIRSDRALTPQHLLQVCDAQGRVLHVKAGNGDAQIDIERNQLRAGLYIVRVLSPEGTTDSSIRVVVE